MKEVTIINYGAGNVRSVASALQRLGAKVRISSVASEIEQADRVIFPGVGHALSAMNFLKTQNLDQVIRSLTQPTLGICLGMQLMANDSQEGDTLSLGLIDSSVKLFSTEDKTQKIPHMGWNNIRVVKPTALLDGISDDDFFYFVHSYYMEVNADTSATCGYINDFSAVVENANFYGCQFHPEKSARSGSKILSNFLDL